MKSGAHPNRHRGNERVFHKSDLEMARLYRLRKNSSFVSGYRFSDTVSHLKSDAPLGAEAAKSTFSAAS